MKFIFDQNNFVVPPLVTESKVNALLSELGYNEDITGSDKVKHLVDTVTVLVYNATGLFKESSEITLTFDGSVTQKVYLPYLVSEISEVTVDGQIIDPDKYSVYPDKIESKEFIFTDGKRNVLIKGKFGWTTLPLAVEQAVKHLLEDYYIKDDFGRLQSGAKDIKVDNVAVSMPKVGFLSTGNRFADNILKNFIYINSPVAKKRKASLSAL